MNKKYALIDLDDTIFDLETKLTEAIPELRHNPPSWRPENKEMILNTIQERKILLSIEPRKHAVDLLNRIIERDIKIKFVTARAWLKHSHQITIDSLKRHGIPYDELIICDLDEDKTQFMNPDNDYVLSVEDNPDNHLVLMKKIPNAYCIKSPGFNYDNIPNVVNCLSEIRV